MQQIMKRAAAIKRGIHRDDGIEVYKVVDFDPIKRAAPVVTIRIYRDPEILAQIKRDVAAGIIPF